jgi:hypothetical protein
MKRPVWRGSDGERGFDPKEDFTPAIWVAVTLGNAAVG